MPQENDYRKSSGISCIRYNKSTKKYEILVIKKRYSYFFASFVFGQYNKKDDKRLKFLFDGMTVQEKIDILSLKFDILWYKIWLEIPEVFHKPKLNFDVTDVESMAKTWKEIYKQKASNNFVKYDSGSMSKLDFYIKKKNKFESSFVSDNGKRLRSLLTDSTHAELHWEIPKGRRSKNETVMDCAIREFEEETNIGIESYNIMFNIDPIVESYVSSHIKYIHSYYIAYTSKVFEPSIKFSNGNQISEVDSIKWVDMDEIQYIDHSGRLQKLVQRIFNIFKSKYKYIEN